MRTVLLLLVCLPTLHAMSAEPKGPHWFVVKPNTHKDKNMAPPCFQPGQETGIVTRGDFDGNGKPDTAKLEQNPTRTKQRLVVYFDDKPTPFVIEEKSPLYSGDYLKTAKGKNGPDRISYGSCRASEVLLTWDPKAKKFTENWLSD
jgi:hypothetical protein